MGSNNIQQLKQLTQQEVIHDQHIIVEVTAVLQEQGLCNTNMPMPLKMLLQGPSWPFWAVVVRPSAGLDFRRSAIALARLTFFGSTITGK